MSGRPRPAHLEIPLDLLDSGRWPTLVPPPAGPVRTPAAESAARRPCSVAPPAPRRGRWRPRSGRRGPALAERLGAPVVTTANGKGMLPEDHPLSLGAGVHLPAVPRLVAGGDVVLAVGTELAPSDLWNGPLPLDGRLVRIDVDAVGPPTRAGRRPRRRRRGPTLDALPRAGSPRPGRGRAGARRGGGEARAEARAEGCRSSRARGGARPPRTRSSPATARWPATTAPCPTWPRPGRGRSSTPPGSAPSATGCRPPSGRRSPPEAPVVALLGDGGIMFTLAELATAADLAALPIVVVDNSGYGEIRHEMIDRDDPVHAVDLGHPDFPGLARSLGCHGVTIEDPQSGLSPPSSRRRSAPTARPCCTCGSPTWPPRRPSPDPAHGGDPMATNVPAPWPLTDEQRQIVELCHDSPPRRSGPGHARSTRRTSRPRWTSSGRRPGRHHRLHAPRGVRRRRLHRRVHPVPGAGGAVLGRPGHRKPALLQRLLRRPLLVLGSDEQRSVAGTAGRTGRADDRAGHHRAGLRFGRRVHRHDRHPGRRWLPHQRAEGVDLQRRRRGVLRGVRQDRHRPSARAGSPRSCSTGTRRA